MYIIENIEQPPKGITYINIIRTTENEVWRKLGHKEKREEKIDKRGEIKHHKQLHYLINPVHATSAAVPTDIKQLQLQTDLDFSLSWDP